MSRTECQEPMRKRRPRPIMMVTGAVGILFRILALNPLVFGLRTNKDVLLLLRITDTITERYRSAFQRTRRIRYGSVPSPPRYWISCPFPSQPRCYDSCHNGIKTTELLLFPTIREGREEVSLPVHNPRIVQNKKKKPSGSNPTYTEDDHLPHPSNDSTVINLPWIDDFTMDTKIFVQQSQQHQQPHQNLTKTRRNNSTNTVELLPNNTSTTGNYSDTSLVTIKDLEQYLRINEFITKKELVSSIDTLTLARRPSWTEEGLSTRKKSSSISSTTASDDTSSSTRSTSSYATSTKGNVGFPQQSELTDTFVIRCTAVTTGLIAMLISRTVAANLWLLGFILGILYGNQIGTNDTIERRSLSEEGGMTTSNSYSHGITSTFLLACGKRFGRALLTMYDAIHVVWYMYKTGKLSYAYYKQYEVLDSRFQITDKIDAWNLRFQEGKLKFDAWEKEHEISRKLLAGLRTVWTVEEQSRKRTSKKFSSPKPRIVLAINNTYSFVSKLLHALWKLMVGGGNTELDSLIKGIQADFNELNFEKVGQQIGSGLSALVALNIVGTLFLKSPAILGIVCFVGGMIWPTWIGGAYNRLIQKVSDTANKGRQVMVLNQSAKEGGRYHYFIREDGTKRWYRASGTTVSSPLDRFLFFKGEPTKNHTKNNIGNFFSGLRKRTNPSEAKAKLRKP